jgi:hypothetical protein
LYKVQHLDQYPNVGTDATGFITRMTTKTNADHTAGGVFGPYLQQFPTNPFNNLATVRIEAGNTAGAGTYGWQFDTDTGAIRADDGGSTSDGIAHSTL